MNYLYFSVIGGIFAGLISTGLYELIRYYYDEWVLLTHPIESKYIGPNKIEVYNTVLPVSAFFGLRNKTKSYLPLSIFVSSCKCINYGPKPIEWVDRSADYSTHDIVLSPLDWGFFKITGIISEPGKCEQPKCDIVINMAVTIPILRLRKVINITIGTLRLEFK